MNKSLLIVDITNKLNDQFPTAYYRMRYVKHEKSVLELEKI